MATKSKQSISFKDPSMFVSVFAVVIAGIALMFSAHAAPLQSSVSLNQLNPHLGQTITFSYSLPKTVKNPQLIVTCFQNQTLVYEQRGLPTDSFLLGGTSSQWLTNGGPANCVANMYDLVTKAGQVNYMVKAVTTFDAAGVQ